MFDPDPIGTALARLATIKGAHDTVGRPFLNHQFRFTAYRNTFPGEHFGEWIVTIDVLHSPDLPTGAVIPPDALVYWRESPFLVTDVDDIGPKIGDSMRALTEWLIGKNHD